jgi:hypothetical protein
MQQVQHLVAAADSVVALISTPQCITDDTAPVHSVVSVDSLTRSAAAAEQTEMSTESVSTIYEGLLQV